MEFRYKYRYHKSKNVNGTPSDVRNMPNIVSGHFFEL